MARFQPGNVAGAIRIVDQLALSDERGYTKRQGQSLANVWQPPHENAAKGGI
jgi:hypothetical protein